MEIEKNSKAHRDHLFISAKTMLNALSDLLFFYSFDAISPTEGENMSRAYSIVTNIKEKLEEYEELEAV